MTDSETRIRDLQKRVERQPGARFFVPLAEEYRRAGRLPDAIRSLEEGLVSHPAYVAARIALARAYLEAGRIEESIGAFRRALSDDPANLVAAKALADLHMSRGEPLEALKQYRLYRDISGDRRLDDLVAKLERDTAALPDPLAAAPLAPLPEPEATPAAPPLMVPQLAPGTLPPSAHDSRAAPRETDPHDISGVTYKRPSTGAVPLAPEEEQAILSRDQSLDALKALRRDDDDIVTRKIRLPEATWPFEPAPAPAPPARSAEPPVPESTPSPEVEAAPLAPFDVEVPGPSGRTLADLYFEQGHFSDAQALYEELLAASPSDLELRERRNAAMERRDAAAPGSGPSPGGAELPTADPGRERRLAKVAVLNSWIDVVRRGREGKSE